MVLCLPDVPLQLVDPRCHHRLSMHRQYHHFAQLVSAWCTASTLPYEHVTSAFQGGRVGKQASHLSSSSSFVNSFGTSEGRFARFVLSHSSSSLLPAAAASSSVHTCITERYEHSHRWYSDYCITYHKQLYLVRLPRRSFLSNNVSGVCPTSDALVRSPATAVWMALSLSLVSVMARSLSLIAS